jgi:hypothetical protein
MSEPSTPSAIEASPFTHLAEMVRAFAEATDPAERRLFLRGTLRALQYVVGRTHDVLTALVAAVSKEGK